MKPPRLIVAFVLIFFAVAARGQVVFTFNLTSVSDNLGYTNGQSASFSFVLNSEYSGSFQDTAYADTMSRIWAESSPSDPQIWSSITGTGLSGSLIRAEAPANHAPSVSMKVWTSNFTTNNLNIIIGQVVNDLGLRTPDGGSVYQVGAAFGFSPVLSYEPPIIEDPTSFFANFEGTKTAWGGGLYFYNPSTGMANFSINDFTISYSNVPEPPTYAAILGFVSMGFVMFRRRFVGSRRSV